MEQIEMEALGLMIRVGGSFASHLAKAWICADLENQRRLKEAFSTLLENYVERVEMISNNKLGGHHNG